MTALPSDTKTEMQGGTLPRITWRLRVAAAVLMAVAAATIWFTNAFLTERYTESVRSKADLRLALYSGNVIGEVQRYANIPRLLSRDPALIQALVQDDYSDTTRRLISYRDEIGAPLVMLLDADGRAVGVTERTLLGTNFRSEPYFIEALRSSTTVFGPMCARTASSEPTNSMTPLRIATAWAQGCSTLTV